jgi:hypothetical protein
MALYVAGARCGGKHAFSPARVRRRLPARAALEIETPPLQPLLFPYQGYGSGFTLPRDCMQVRRRGRTFHERLLPELLPNSVARDGTGRDGERFGTREVAVSRGLRGTSRYAVGPPCTNKW